MAPAQTLLKGLHRTQAVLRRQLLEAGDGGVLRRVEPDILAKADDRVLRVTHDRVEELCAECEREILDDGMVPDE